MRLSRSTEIAITITTALFCVLNSLHACADGKQPSQRNAPKLLFSCHADSRYELSGLQDPSSDQTYSVSNRMNFDGDIKLTITLSTRTAFLTISVEGHRSRTFALKDLEQGSSPTSGAGGKADTTIRGKSKGNTFTLFAEFDSNGFDHDAALQIEGERKFLLACDDDEFLSPSVKGLGQYGRTSIYGLSYDGLAKKIEDIPSMPSY